jgi:phospho-N-acetylmuramoyl-pentapeptide-transferase
VLYSFLISFIDQFSALNVFRYLTFRTGLSVMSSMTIVFLIGDFFIRFIESHKITGPIRDDGPSDHIIKKVGTPTMGGILILIGILFGTLLWADLSNPYIWVLLMVVTSFGFLGGIDDYLKIKHSNSKGISSGMKIICQIILSLIAIFLLIQYGDSEHLRNIYFPFFKNLTLHLGLFFIPFAIFIIVGSSNAVNLTDGLDGLATVPVMLVALSFTLICYVVGNTVFSEYLQISYITNVGEASIFCGSIVGSCLGFLWFNAPPAKIFMGDTGSLPLGASLGALGIITKHEIVLGIIGGLFVLETVSVIIQVISFKLTGKRVFMMAPLHHHYEKKGWAESTVVIRFWIISIILALIGLATLKLR